MTNDYRIPHNPISVRNTQANVIVERDSKSFNIICKFKIQHIKGILSSTMFAIRSTVHTNTHHTLSQLVFGRDTILNINQEANQ